VTLQLPPAGRSAPAEPSSALSPPPGRPNDTRPGLAQLFAGLFAPPGLRVPRHRSTTAHLAAVYPCQTEAGLGPNGLYLGTDGLSGGAAFCFDPFVLYTAEVLRSGNILVLGRQGFGKSTFVKTFLYRCIGAFGAPDLEADPPAPGRWAAICDPKGEYQDLAAALGLQVVRLHPGGAERINPLDAGPSGAAEPVELEMRRTGMVTALLSAVLRRDPTPEEESGIASAVAAVTKGGDQATLVDIADLLACPTEEMAVDAGCSAQRLVEECRQAKLGLGRLLGRDLRGMFDGPSTVRIDWSGRGMVLDLSGVHQDPDALATVMIPATSWLSSFMADPDPASPRKVQVIEECWAMLRQAKVAFYLQRCWKLCRDYGVANIAVAHRLSDLRAQADDGTATSKVAAGLLADTETRVIFRQSSDQRDEARSLLGLSAKEAELVVRLAKGVALWKVANHTAVVTHRVGPKETFVDTDRQMAV
jgi:type IV secretory pathway VirB4 component